MKTTVYTDKAPAAIGPYSQAIVVNGFLYTSGQIALNPETGDLEMQNIEHETGRVMLNLQALLEAVKMDFSNVIKTTIYLSDMAYYDQVNAVYAGFFEEHPPAREAVQVAGLPKGVNVEISCVAFKA
jgi:2-iminobutanoate/2-iminopropanoate deaminase